MTHLKKLIAALCVIAALSGLAGCGALIVGGASAAGTYVYMHGFLKRDYHTGIDHAFDASRAACRDFGIAVTEISKDGTSGAITGKYRDDTVWIRMKLVGDNQTEISVRIGLLGDEANSRRLHNAIARKL